MGPDPPGTGGVESESWGGAPPSVGQLRPAQLGPPAAHPAKITAGLKSDAPPSGLL